MSDSAHRHQTDDPQVPGGPSAPATPFLRSLRWVFIGAILFSLVGNAVALVVVVLAGVVNLVVGPRNPVAFAVVFLIQIGFVAILLALMDTRPAGTPPPFWLAGREKAGWLGRSRLNPWSLRQIMLDVFLFLSTPFFLLISIILLYAAVTGTINPL